MTLEKTSTLKVSSLAKAYGNVHALADLNLDVTRGEVYGFLGRNGAGKSTTIRIIMGITQATSGSVHLFGEKAEGRRHVALRQRIGYVAQEQNFYGWMTPKTLGSFLRGFYPTWDDTAYAKLLQGLELPERRIRTFSGGMKVKLALAAALAYDPELLVLDEPTAGLDPVARREFLEMVRDQAERSSRTTFFSTHLIDEIELAAHRVGIVDNGRTRYEGTVRDLAARVRLLRCPAPNGVAVPLPERIRNAPQRFEILQDRHHQGHQEVIVMAADAADFGEWNPGASFVESLDGARQTTWNLAEMPLEEIFIEMVRRPLDTAL